MAKIIDLDPQKYNLENDDPERLKEFDHLSEEEIEKMLKEIKEE